MLKIIAKIILFFLIHVQKVIIRCKGYCYKLTEAKIEDYYKGEELIEYYESSIPLLVKDLNDLCTEYNQNKNFQLLSSQASFNVDAHHEPEHHSDVEPKLALDGFNKAQQHKENHES